jgi:hypothetical protein
LAAAHPVMPERPFCKRRPQTGAPFAYSPPRKWTVCCGGTFWGNGTFLFQIAISFEKKQSKDIRMNNIIYIIGLVVVVLAILSFLGLS